MREKPVLAINYVSHAASNLGGGSGQPFSPLIYTESPLIFMETGEGQATTACDLASKTSPKHGTCSSENFQEILATDSVVQLSGFVSE